MPKKKKPTIRQLIIVLLDAKSAPMTIAEIYEEFEKNGVLAAKPTIRAQLNRLCEHDEIQRIRQGVYASNNVDRDLHVVDDRQPELDFGDDLPPPIPDERDGFDFTTEKNLIDVDRSYHRSNKNCIATHLTLLKSVREFLRISQGTNAYTEIRSIMVSYERAIRGNNISIDEMYAIGVRLEVGLEEFSKRMEQGELPDAEISLTEPLYSVLALHGVAVLSTGHLY